MMVEVAENTCRKGFTPEEYVAGASRLEPLVREEAAKRQKRPSFACEGKFPQQERLGKTRDHVGSAFGVSGRTFEKAKHVVEAAKAQPDLFGDLVPAMNEGGAAKWCLAPTKKKAASPFFCHLKSAKVGPLVNE